MVVMFGDAFVVAEALTVFRVIQTNYLTKKSPKMAIEKRQPIDKQTISVLCCTQSRIAPTIINTYRKSPNLTDNQPITHYQL